MGYLPAALRSLEPEAQIQGRCANSQAVELEIREPIRQRGVDVEASGGSIGAEAQNGLDELEGAAGSPCLGELCFVGAASTELAALRAQLGSWRSWPAPTGPQDLADPASRYSWAQEILGRCLRVPLREIG